MKFQIVEDKYSATDVYEMVQSIHPRKEDFEEGDLADRIYNYSVYQEQQVSIEKIDDEWNINDDFVEKLAKRIESGEEKVSPIVLDKDYGIIDGAHRVEAYRKLKVKSIPALVAIE